MVEINGSIALRALRLFSDTPPSGEDWRQLAFGETVSVASFRLLAEKLKIYDLVVMRRGMKPPRYIVTSLGKTQDLTEEYINRANSKIAPPAPEPPKTPEIPPPSIEYIMKENFSDKTLAILARLDIKVRIMAHLFNDIEQHLELFNEELLKESK